MLDKIHGAQTDSITQSTSLDRINEIALKDHYKDNDSNYIVDESQISQEAYDKYIREQDIKRFSKILLESDEQEANNLVLKKAFDGTISIDDDDFLSELIDSSDLINEIFWKN